jgi:hypothetical protein
VHWPAVVVAALSGFPLGFVWYGPLFGKAWMEASGVSMARAKASNPMKIYPTVLVLNLIAATGLALLIGQGNIRIGVHTGFFCSVAFAAVAFGISYLFEFRPLRLWLINSAYMVVFFSLMGAILGAWH